MSLKSLVEFVLNAIDSRSCFHLVCCSCKMSFNISLFSVCILLATSYEGELSSNVVPCTDFVSDVSIESRAQVFDSPVWDMEFTVFGDYVG